MMKKNTTATDTTMYIYSPVAVEEEGSWEDGGPSVGPVVIGVGDGEVVEGGERMGGGGRYEEMGGGGGGGDEGDEVALTTVVEVGREGGGVVRIIGVEVTGMS